MITDDVDSLIDRVANKINRIEGPGHPAALERIWDGMEVIRRQILAAPLTPGLAPERALAHANLLAASLEACHREAPTLLNRMRADEALNLAIRLAADPEDRS